VSEADVSGILFMSKAPPDLFSDPFLERAPYLESGPVSLLGSRFHFQSNSQPLLDLVNVAYAGLPAHRLPAGAPRIRIGLRLLASKSRQRRSEPAPLQMLSGAGYVVGASDSSLFVVMDAAARTALVTVPERMLRFPYHTRYELIEFAVFTLATRVRGLIPLHGACVGSGRRGVILMGASGSGKSTVSLQCLSEGLDFVSEDSTFVMTERMLCTGVANFVHVRSDSLRWIGSRDAAAIRRSPVISRRSGVRKFELDLRKGNYRLARAPVQLTAVVFLSTTSAGGGPLLQPLSKAETLRRLAVEQPYAAQQPGWAGFCRKVTQRGAFELRRGQHPREAVTALRHFLRHGAP
jgi:energy-coupling factor transporter ATP-binding protein EcfA2